jgi:predicted DsbA family dithiol-disulfide isomerase
LTLLSIADQHGLQKEVVKEVINKESNIQQAADKAGQWSMKGVNGM